MISRRDILPDPTNVYVGGASCLARTDPVERVNEAIFRKAREGLNWEPASNSPRIDAVVIRLSTVCTAFAMKSTTMIDERDRLEWKN